MKRTLYPSLLIVAFSAFAALAAPASSLAASCPAGQKGTPPYCEKETTPAPTPTPPPPLTTTATANEVASGAVKVTFSVPGGGTLTLKGKAIKLQKVTVSASGSVTVTLKATGKVLQHLENKGWTRRKQITVTFTAADGSTQTINVVVRFRKP